MPVRAEDGRSMRKLFIYMVILALCGCEVIPENERLIPVETAPEGQRTHVLLEFTGFRCVNCPTATETALALQEVYGEHLTVVALHPASNPFTQGKYDYTCPAADSIYRWMGGDASTPFPAGNLDMQEYAGEWFVNMSEWATMVYQAVSDTVVPSLDSAELSYWLVEDSVKGVQAMPDGSVNMEYYHRHVLRDIQPNKADITIPEGSNTAQLYLITVYSDPNDKHILQAYEKKLFDGGLMPALDD